MSRAKPRDGAAGGYRLIALDLDGTLNNDQKQIDPPTRRALLAVQGAGVRLMLASARPLPGLYKGPGRAGAVRPRGPADGLQRRDHRERRPPGPFASPFDGRAAFEFKSRCAVRLDP